jgi:hypothetical protein
MGPNAPAAARVDLSAWIDRLEGDPRWTERYRAKLAARACDPCDLVLLIAPACDYPRSAEHARERGGSGRLVDGFVVVVGSIGEVLETLLPIDARAFTGEQARALRDHAHAVIMDGPIARALRFRAPTA